VGKGGREIADRRIRIGALWLLAAGLAYLAFQVRAALLPFVLAVVLAFVLEPPVTFLVRRRIPRLTSIIIVYAAVGLAASITLLSLVPVFVRQLNVLAETLPRLAGQVERILLDAQNRYAEAGLPSEVRLVLDSAISRAETSLLSVIESILSGLFGAVSGALTLLLAPFLAFYFLRDRDAIRSWFVAAMPVSVRGDTLLAVAEANRVVAGFIRGQLLAAIIVGVMVGLAAYFIGLPFSAILGVVAGITNVIPYFGPIIGGIPAVALALLEGRGMAAGTVAVLFIVQQIDSMFITPRLVGQGVGLHPLVVVFSLLAGAEMFGVLGMLAAVPVVALGRILIKHVYARLVASQLSR
jgi:predicted PurR-regulated permease PerM